MLMGAVRIRVAVVNSKGVIDEETVMVPQQYSCNAFNCYEIGSCDGSRSKLKNYFKTKSIGVGIAVDIDFSIGLRSVFAKFA
ncbi:MAG: hypothetical protein LE168_04310 [Endomicrobium sp.]|nr:hypothetical protein [Endomicrobium sp.]